LLVRPNRARDSPQRGVFLIRRRLRESDGGTLRLSRFLDQFVHGLTGFQIRLRTPESRIPNPDSRIPTPDFRVPLEHDYVVAMYHFVAKVIAKNLGDLRGAASL